MITAARPSLCLASGTHDAGNLSFIREKTRTNSRNRNHCRFAEPIHWRSAAVIVYTFQARIADRWQDGRVFLLGDAAHLTPPYAGQGLNSGQRDASNFAWKAAAVINGQFGLSLMDTYEIERRAHAWSLIQMAIQIGWVMVPRNWFHTYGQIAFFRFAGLVPKLRDYFLGMKFKPEPRFKEGFLVPDDETPKRTLVGRMVPQPAVATEGGGMDKLDDVMGPGFSLLAIGRAAAAEMENFDHPVWAHLGAERVALVPRDTKVSETARRAAIGDTDLPQVSTLSRQNPSCPA